MTGWANRCVLCVTRMTERLRRDLQREPTVDEVLARVPRLETGHICPGCQVRIADDLDAIVTLCAAASTEPATGRGQGHTVPGSRPPLNVDGLDPELTVVPGTCATVLDIVESWTRLVLEARQMALYGPWSHAAALRAHMARTGTRATLTACVAFLRAQAPWMAETPDFPIEDYADEIRACVRALRRFDPDRERPGTAVACPTLTDRGDCGAWLAYKDPAEEVTCPRCRVTRTAMTLATVAMSDGREVWLDPQAAATWLGISEGHLRRLAARGAIPRNRGRYLIRDTRHAVSHP